MNIFLTGSTGFIGGHMLRRLLEDGHRVRALVRNPESERARVPPGFDHDGNVEYLRGDVVSGAGLDKAVEGCEAVVHLVGIIQEKGSNTFQAVHHIGTRNVVQAARRSAIRRFVHMSALGVRPDGIAAYQMTKWKGEEEVRQSGIAFCILRPSLVFGPGDGFVTEMMDVMKKAPLFRPVPGDGSPKFRPILVDDVTYCFSKALTEAAATNQTIELGGADELTLDEVLAEIARCAGVRKPAVHIPLSLMFVAAALTSFLAKPPVTADQLRMLREGSTCDIGPMKRIFCLQPRGFRGCGRG
jgi:NADH dehydrogenase